MQLHDSIQDMKRYLNEIVIPSGFLFSESATQPTVMSIAMGVLLAEFLDSIPASLNETWKTKLLENQDQATGLFNEPLLLNADLVQDDLDETYVRYQTTYFCLNALDALNAVPDYPLTFLTPYFDRDYLSAWLDGLDWSQPWRESNWVMFIAGGLYAEWIWNESELAYESLDLLLDWLDIAKDPETGFWGTDKGATLRDAMAGAYHFLPFYFCLGRPFQYIERMIDNTLRLQASDGLFHPDGGGDACLDVDAVDILVKCTLLTDYRRTDVNSALERAYRGLLENQSRDGGFCRARNRPYPGKSLKRRFGEIFGLDTLLRKPYVPYEEIHHYSGWKLMSYDIRQSDIWSTWFRSYGLLAIRSLEQPVPLFMINVRFRRFPALGWHDVGKVLHLQVTNGQQEE
jgi:hypothetical protein